MIKELFVIIDEATEFGFDPELITLKGAVDPATGLFHGKTNCSGLKNPALTLHALTSLARDKFCVQCFDDVLDDKGYSFSGGYGAHGLGVHVDGLRLIRERNDNPRKTWDGFAEVSDAFRVFFYPDPWAHATARAAFKKLYWKFLSETFSIWRPFLGTAEVSRILEESACIEGELKNTALRFRESPRKQTRSMTPLLTDTWGVSRATFGTPYMVALLALYSSSDLEVDIPLVHAPLHLLEPFTWARAEIAVTHEALPSDVFETLCSIFTSECNLSLNEALELALAV